MKRKFVLSIEKIQKYRKIDKMYTLSLVVNQNFLKNVNTSLCMIASKWLEFPDE